MGYGTHLCLQTHNDVEKEDGGGEENHINLDPLG